MNISLGQFSKDYNLAKTTVYNVCQRLNISTSEGLDPDAVATLKAEFKLDRPEPQAEPEAQAVRTDGVEVEATVIEVGNHQMVLATPELPQTFSLESLRTTDSVQIADPLAAATQFLAVADQLTAAMASDIQARQTRLGQTQQAKEAIAVKRQQLELEARLYQLEASRLDTAQTATTQQLQVDLASLQRLGKPNPGNSGLESP